MNAPKRSNRKFAFLVHHPTLMDHLSGVWKALDTTSFAIVLTSIFDKTDSDGAALLSHAKRNGYEVFDIEDALQQNIQFDYVVTNHHLSGKKQVSKRHRCNVAAKRTLNQIMRSLGLSTRWKLVSKRVILPLQIGRRQIRFMYGADLSDGWSLKPWNEIYDLFLCHGVNDERIVSQRFPGKTFIMGYPRYDAFFEDDLDTSTVKEEFDLDGGKKTILWMPTLGLGHSSIPFFAEAVSSLMTSYNVIVRPHPMSFEQEPEVIEILERLDFRIDRKSSRNMNYLFKAADLVLADYGGTPFSTIFLGKNLLLLDDPAAAELPINSNSTVSELRDDLPGLSPEQVLNLPTLLEGKSFWTENKTTVDSLFNKFFGGYRGGGSLRVAKYFQNIDENLDKK